MSQVPFTDFSDLFSIFDYTENVIVECAEDMKNSRSYYPGNDQIFKITKHSPRLPPEDANMLYCRVARLLSASKRARPAKQVCVAFLCTQVKSLKEEDYTKLKRVISYKTILHMPPVVGADNSVSLTWNIDTLFTVHPDMESHTGAFLTLRHGSLLSLLFKYKINAESSTEAELVRVDDTMIFVIRMKHFFESRVRFINKNSPFKLLGFNVAFEQDNTSVIQLEKNGWKSSSKKTKHIVVRYFYIIDRLQEGDVSD